MTAPAPLLIGNSQIVLSGKLMAVALLLGSVNIGTGSAHINLPDSMFSGHVAGGSSVGSGTAGIIAGSFSSSGAETGAGSGEGGLGTSDPYPAADFGAIGNRIVSLAKEDGDEIALSDVASYVTGADASAPLIGLLSYRSDASSNQKWRLWLYGVASDGSYSAIAPDTALNGVQIVGWEVVELQSLPASALQHTVKIGQSVASLVLGANAVDTTELADGAVTTDKLDDLAVTGPKLADNAVTEDKLDTGAVTNAKIAVGTIGGDKLSDSTITGDKLVNDAVTPLQLDVEWYDKTVTASSTTTIDLDYPIDNRWLHAAIVDRNGQMLHWGSSADVSHYTINGTAAGGNARVTFGAAIPDGEVNVKYAGPVD